MEFVWILPGGDTADAFAVRSEVFVEEQGFSGELEFDDIDPIAHHIIVYDGSRSVGTGRIFPDKKSPDTYVAGRIAIRKSLRGTGLGRDLVLAMVDKAAELGAKRVALGAQMQAKGFYERCGFQVCGEEYMDEHCPHVPMMKPTGSQ